MAQRTILFSFAHPDDEQGNTGTMARYLGEGARVGLICATRGEVGEIAPGVDATPETLGQVREQELRAAMGVVGNIDLWFLDYRDSGMAGTAENADPAAFVNAAPDEVVERIVSIMRGYKPQVVVTFDPTGFYFHPDHLASHQLTVAAYHAAGDPAAYPAAGEPWAPARLYYTGIPRSALTSMRDFAGENAPDSSFARMDFDNMGIPDEQLTHHIDVLQHVDMKRESVAKHASQMAPDSPMSRMPEEQELAWRGTEHYALAEGVPLPAAGPHDDLFACLDV